ncbi:MAG: protein TolQ, partial [Burkholderiales bacterium]|nr:protein TolQ [Burkholderiales bacterium]
MNQDFSIFTLVTQASFVVQLVMAGLMIASLASWTVIFGKLFGLKRVRTANEDFERDFWAGKNINDLYADAIKRTDGSPMQRIFASGMREFMKLRERRVLEPGALLDGARRAMRASFQRELDAIEANLS